MGTPCWLPSACRLGAGGEPHLLEGDEMLPLQTRHWHDICCPRFSPWCPWRLFTKLTRHLPPSFPPHFSCKPNTLCRMSPGKLTAPSNFSLLCPGLLSVFDNPASITGSLRGAYPSCLHQWPAMVCSSGLSSFPLTSFSSKFPHSLNCLTLSHLRLLTLPLQGGQGVPVVIKVNLYKWAH